MSGKCSHKQYKLVLIQAIQVLIHHPHGLCVSKLPLCVIWRLERALSLLCGVFSVGGWFFPVTNAPRRRSASGNVCRLSKHAGCVIKEEEQKALKLLCRVSDDVSQWLLLDGWISQSASFLSLLHHNTQHCKGVSEVQSQSYNGQYNIGCVNIANIDTEPIC